MALAIESRIKAAQTRLAAMLPTRSSSTPEGLTALVNRVLSAAVYDWRQVDAALFPSGSLSDVDLADPLRASAWKALRTQHTDALTQALASHAPSQGFAFSMSGLVVDLTADKMAILDPVEYDRDELCDIMVSLGLGVFNQPASTNRAGTTRQVAWRNRYENRRHTALTRAEAQVCKLTEVMGIDLDGHLSLHQLVPEQVSNLVPHSRALESLSLLPWSLHASMALKAWEKRNAASASAPTPDPNKRTLDGFLRERIEKAQMRQDQDTAFEHFSAFDILGKRALQAGASRTWGIELEVIDAKHILTPPNWNRERDHSLRENIGDGRTYDPWEFISPILSKTYDQGLWMVCDQAENTVKYYKAGVHVHVSAQRSSDQAWMTTAEVSRLIELYALINKLLDPVIQRKQTKEFCVPTRFDQWANGWYTNPSTSKAKRPRKPAKRATDARANAKLWAAITHGPNHDSEPTEWKRHQEVNLQSLNKYGTIEFRAMGAVYSYDYLVRWAWLCRELVNYAQSEQPLAPFYQMRSLDEVLTFIAAHAVEKLAVKKVKASPKRPLKQVAPSKRKAGV